MSGLSNLSTSGSQGAVVPPMQGTSAAMSWTTPSGVVRRNVPPENAQIKGLSAAFASVTR
jgi:hypothetical protein